MALFKIPKRKNDKYSHLVRQRKAAIISERVKTSKSAIKIPVKVLIILPVVFVVMLGYYFLTSNIFNIKNIELVNPVTSHLENAGSYIEKYNGQNILRISERAIADDIKKDFSGIESVYVFKRFPDSILIEIVESNPAFVFSNLDTSYLVKNNGEILNELQGVEGVKLLEFEKNIIRQGVEVNANYVKERFLADLTEEEREDVKWEEVSEDQKRSTAESIQNEVNSKLQSYRSEVLDQITQSSYSDLPIIFFYDSEVLDQSTLLFALKVLDGVKLRDLNPEFNTFVSSYTLQVDIRDNKKLLFSSRRNQDDQFKDLDSLIFNGKLSGAKTVDLRSQTYSITR